MKLLSGWWLTCSLLAAACSAPAARARDDAGRDPAPPASARALGPGFTDQYAQVNGVRLHYVRGGDGPPLLLLPGWPETWWSWRKVMPSLAKHYTVIALDTRGMGDSSRPDTGYDMDTIEGDVLGLMRQLGFNRFRLVGHDIGVWISYAIAADHPQAVERVALVDSNLPGVSPPVEIFLPKADNTHSWHFMFNQLDDLPELLVQGRERQFLTWIYTNYAYKPQTLAIDEYVRVYSMPGAMRAGFAYYRALPQTIEQNHRRMRTRLGLPVLALGGQFGTADKAETTLKPYADHLRGTVLPGCGHYVAEECPQELLQALEPFLEGR